jgi:hypothetical protein
MFPPPNLWIGRGGPTPWGEALSRFNPITLFFFSWGFIKSEMHRKKSRFTKFLQQHYGGSSENNPLKIRKNAFPNAADRFEICSDPDGAYLEINT